MGNEIFAFIHSKTGFGALLILIAFLVFYFNQIRRQRHRKRWQRALNLDKHYLVFQQLYKEVDGFSLSRQARLKSDALEYVYGEIEFIPFISLLSLVKPQNETIFYDLGSGTGKAVLAAAMVYPLKKSVGVELFPQLYLSACKQVEQLAKRNDYALNARTIAFIQGDFLEVNFNEATLIFINSTSFFGPTWEHLCSRLNSLPHLETVITTSKPLLSTDFRVVASPKIQMSWGIIHAYIHTRKTNFN